MPVVIVDLSVSVSRWLRVINSFLLCPGTFRDLVDKEIISDIKLVVESEEGKILFVFMRERSEPGFEKRRWRSTGHGR
jgi:hypothetical protein